MVEMKRPFYILLLIFLFLPVTSQGQTWESLNARTYPQWFSDAKLGIFVHWGLYSVPAYAGKEGYAEWFYRGLMRGDPDRRRIMSLYADTTLPVFEQYKELTKYWRAELWNPAEWARMFKEAGAKYVVLVTKHHDGYCLWDSPQQPEWNSVVSGPKRNIVSELTEAVRNEGLRMGFYYSLPEWTNQRCIWMQEPEIGFRNYEKRFRDYVDNYMVPQFKELVTRYKPELLFADGDWNNTSEEWRSVELIDWYYTTVGPDAIVNDRWGQGTKHGFRTPEYSAGIADTSRPWAECRGIGRSFGYNRNEDLENFLTDRELIQHFCELVAHGGGLTLNVGPMADGTIPFIQQERLRALGHWLEVNGEAIYSTRSYSTPCQREHFSAPMPPTKQIDYDWVRNAPLKDMPVDNFDIHWHGTVTIPEDGLYEVLGDIEGLSGDKLTVVRNGTDTLPWHNLDVGEATNYAAMWKKGYTCDLDVYYHEHDLEARVSLKVLLDWSESSEALAYDPISLDIDWQGIASWERTLRCFTTKGDDLYVIEFERPNQTLTIPDMPRLKKGTAITLLGTTGKVKWEQTKDGTLTLDLSTLDPKELNALDHAWVFRIEK